MSLNRAVSAHKQQEKIDRKRTTNFVFFIAPPIFNCFNKVKLYHSYFRCIKECALQLFQFTIFLKHDTFITQPNHKNAHNFFRSDFSFNYRALCNSVFQRFFHEFSADDQIFQPAAGYKAVSIHKVVCACRPNFHSVLYYGLLSAVNKIF